MKLPKPNFCGYLKFGKLQFRKYGKWKIDKYEKFCFRIFAVKLRNLENKKKKSGIS